MCRLIIFFKLWEEGVRGIFLFFIYEDSALVKSIFRSTMLFYFYDIKSRFFFAEVFKTYPYIIFIYLKISLYVFELFFRYPGKSTQKFYVKLISYFHTILVAFTLNC